MAPSSAQPRLLVGAASASRAPGAPRELACPTVAEVYDAEVGYVVRCLRSLGVPAEGVDDAVQDLFMVVQKRLPEFDGKGRIRTWLYAIALRIARKHHSRRARDAARFVAERDSGVAGGEEARIVDDRLALARAALERLPDDKREVFVLAQIEELSGPEVAQVTGLPLGTVYSRLRAARSAFDAQVARLEQADSARPRAGRRSRT